MSDTPLVQAKSIALQWFNYIDWRLSGGILIRAERLARAEAKKLNLRFVLVHLCMGCAKCPPKQT